MLLGLLFPSHAILYTVTVGCYVCVVGAVRVLCALKGRFCVGDRYRVSTEHTVRHILMCWNVFHRVCVHAGL